MKMFVAFLAGALLGSFALWFFVIGGAPSPAYDVPAAVVAAPATTPAPAVADPAVAAADLQSVAPPATTVSPPPGEPEPGTTLADSAAPAAPATPMPQAAAVAPPETPPVAPIGANASPVPGTAPTDAAALPPMRALALLLPVQGVVATQLRDTFKDARSEGRVHDAIDIMAPTGTPVFAVEDGTIAKLFDSKLGGLTIYQFDTAGELAYYYAHLSRYAPGLAEKQSVKRGDVIGYVGYTGNANVAAPHLHFAIFRLGPEKQWWKGTSVDPYPYLGGR